MPVEITLLGRFTVCVDGAEVPAAAWSRRQAAGLVKLLALAPRRQLHREQVVDALWPDLPAGEAGPRLHKAAHFARRILGAGSVILRSETVALLPDATVSVDALDFAVLADDALASGGVAEAAKAAQAYPGPLLPDDVYETWTVAHRDRLEFAYLRLLRQARQWAELAEFDPTDEEAHLELMRRYVTEGDARAALRQYERLDRALHRELGVAPGPEVTALRDSLLAGDAEPSPAAEAVEVIVGRQAQLQELARIVAAAAKGRGWTVLLSGAAGTGKTLVARRICAQLAAEGWRTGAGMASQVEGAWPYAPALDAVADLCRRHPALLDGVDDRCREDIERALSGRDLDWSGDGGHQRLYVAVAELLRLAAAGTGVLITVDNLHEADDASLRLLHYLSRSLMGERFMLLLSHRRQPVTEMFEQMRSSLLSRGAAVDVALGPLSRDETSELVSALRADLSPGAVEQIWNSTGGLPFAVAEAARLAELDGAAAAAPGAVVLNLLDPRTRSVLEIVALAGSTFDTDEFVALAGLEDEVEALDCLDAALAAMVIERTSSGFRFRHQLIREALLAAIPAHRDRVLHRACAARLATLDRSPARIGHHLLAAGEANAAVPYVLRAAETEAAVGAYRDALALLESIQRAATGDELSRALALRADLLAAIGDAAAATAYRQAMEIAPPAGRRLLQARLARMLAYAGDLDGAEALLAGLEPGGDAADSSILLAKGALSYFRGDLDAAREVSDRARRLVTRSDTDWKVLDLVTLQGLVAHNRGEWYQQLRLELRRTRDDPALATTVFDSHLCVAELMLYGPTPYAEVIELASALRDTAIRAGAIRAVAFAGALIGEAALLAGDLDLAERELREAVDLHREIGAPSGEAHSLQRLAQVHLARDDRPGAVRLLNRALPLARWSNQATHLIHRVFGTMIAAADGPHQARAIVDRAWATLATSDTCLFCEIMLIVPSSIACAAAGDVEDARRYLAMAERAAERWHGTAWQAATIEARAHLVRAEGDEPQAARLLSEAAGIFEAAGQPHDAERCRRVTRAAV
jgi:DNA-binding SARP family transcriptional activator/predicted negative regulator of RcsB-dependent stress response